MIATLMAQLQDLAAHRVRIKHKQIIVRRALLRHRLDDFLGHNATDDSTDRADLRVQVASVTKKMQHTLWSHVNLENSLVRA